MDSVKQFLSENGIVWIRVCWCSLNGVFKEKAVFSPSFETIFSQGIRVPVVDFEGSFHDEVSSSSSSEAADVRLCPDWESLTVLPWCKGHARVFALAEDINNSDPFPLDPRTWCKQVQSSLQTRFGFNLKASFEEEFYVLGNTSSGWVQIELSYDGVAKIFDAVAKSLEDQRIEVELVHAESGCGQFEVVWKFVDCLKAADYHLLSKETIKKHFLDAGFKVTFVPKPFKSSAGSGAHVHFSLWKGLDNLMPDLANKTCDANFFVKGVAAHLRALVAIAQPTLNSYDRSRPGSFAGAFMAVGRSRICPVRICVEKSKCTNVELRIPDGTCNPYLLLGCILLSGMDGLMKRECFEEVQEECVALCERLPQSLSSSIAAFQLDDVICKGMGLLSNVFARTKNYEVDNPISKSELMKMF